MGNNYDPETLFLKGHDYSGLVENKGESTDKEELADKEEYVDLSDNSTARR